MENNYTSGQSISITNPSQLVLSVDEFFRLSKRVPYNDEILLKKEQSIFGHLGERKIAKFPKILMFELSLSKIEDQVNEKYQDGFDLEDEYDVVRYQTLRSTRTKPSTLSEPVMVPQLSPNKISSVKVGNYRIMQQSPILINREGINSSMPSYEETNNRVR